MNGLVLYAGANKTVRSLEFSKTRLQPLVKPRKREQLLLELEQEHEAIWVKKKKGVAVVGGEYDDESRITESFSTTKQLNHCHTTEIDWKANVFDLYIDIFFKLNYIKQKIPLSQMCIV